MFFIYKPTLQTYYEYAFGALKLHLDRWSSFTVVLRAALLLVYSNYTLIGPFF